MSIKSIPVAGPWITEKEIEYVTDAIKNGWFQEANGYITRFEESFKKYLGRKHAISLPSCTSALHLSLEALGVGPGDEVIIPDATWIASAAPIKYVGATPIFADIDPQSWCLSAESVKPLITAKTKAIIAVNLYGHMPNYSELLKLGIPVIEDAAESVASTLNGKLSGTFGITSCFSFHGSKTLTTGEGGMLLTDDDKIFERASIMRDHGRRPGDTLFQNIEVGFKYKMSNLQAALGLAQLERIQELLTRKREIFAEYKKQFADLEHVKMNPDFPGVENSYWMSTATFSDALKMNKFEMIAAFSKAGIATRPFFEPLSSLKAYESASDRERASKKNTHSYKISARSINLPSAATVSVDDVKRIKEVILSFK